MSTTQSPNIPAHLTAKGAQRVQELIDAATELFLERGFDAVAVDDLIARVGGSRRNIYCHFGGKDGLFIAAMTQLCAEIAAPMEMLNIGEKDPRTALSTFGRQLLKTLLDPRTLAAHRLMIAESKRFPDVSRAMYQAGPAKVINAVAQWIEDRQSDPDGTITSQQQASVLADQFIYLVIGHSQLSVLVGLQPQPTGEAEIRNIVDSAVTTFLHGIQTK